MDATAGAGLLGVAVALGPPGAAGAAARPRDLCTATQSFGAVVISVPRSMLDVWGVCADEVEAAPSGAAVAIRSAATGAALLTAAAWRGAFSAADVLPPGVGGELLVSLAKDSAFLGSWAQPFSALAARGAGGAAALVEWDVGGGGGAAAAALNLLAARRAEAAAVRAEFAQAVLRQLGPGVRTARDETVLAFPAEGAHCLRHLRGCAHLPAVARLLRVVHAELGLDLAAAAARATGERDGDDDARHEPLVSLAAAVAAGLAAVEQRRAALGLRAVQGAVAAVGFGAGEYAAAVFAGVLTLRDALALVRAHAGALRGPEEDSGGPAAAVLDALASVRLRPPRGTALCGATAEPYGPEPAAALARAACSGAPTPARRRLALLALQQQGWVELGELVPEAEPEPEPPARASI
jgi:hypothetical protein